MNKTSGNTAVCGKIRTVRNHRLFRIICFYKGMGMGMLKSMTGYGRATGSFDGMDITLELKSVNHRYF